MNTLHQLFLVIFLIQTVSGASSWLPFSGESEEPELEMKNVPSPYPQPPPVYEPVKTIVEKPMIKVTKKEKKTEWEEKCRITFKKSDILMLTILHDPFTKPMAVTPIILASETIAFTYYTPKAKPLSATKKLLKSFKFSKIPHDMDELDIDLQLDPATAELIKPYANPNNMFILTIITKEKHDLKIKSHFVDSILTTAKKHY
ncbi:uncharacterized protein LOC128388076 [Panonychus citri]|uniref:uncharacterized protein LOC128388076 n=1 Tax=Panonychus citri TaxID=50023 RepID=UPI00230817C0|nr:uncharacterized protein LOC128388076 [Panonychus citri]XP_053203516.1 uncharacterized protein LOC128388076 [Panonychus citri]